MVVDIPSLLEQVGFKVEGVDRIRLARGVVGKTSYVAMAALAVLLVVAWGLKGDVVALVMVAAVALLLFLAFFGGILWFAAKNPGVALLEGAELLQWRQMDMGAKGLSEVPESPHVEATKTVNGTSLESE